MPIARSVLMRARRRAPIRVLLSGLVLAASFSASAQTAADSASVTRFYGEWLRRSLASSPYSVRPEGIAVNELRFLGPTWVLYRSTLRGQRVPKAGGDPVPFETKYVDLLHRTDSGRWEVAHRMWSDNR